MEEEKKYTRLFNFLIWIEIIVLFLCMVALVGINLIAGSRVMHSDFVLWVMDLSIVLKIVCVAGIAMISIVATILINKAHTEKKNFL